MDGEPLVSVVVPARDAGRTLRRALEATAAQALDGPFEVIVVDDGSRDRTAAIAEAFGAPVRLVRAGAARGPGGARNLGVAASGAPMLAFTDADCFPAPGWLAAGLRALETADLVQGAVRPDPAVPRTPCDRTVEVTAENGLYQTANLFVRRAVFEAAGGFEDWLLGAAPGRRWAPDRRRGRATRTPIGEDTAFAWAARRLGATTAFEPAAVVHHDVAPGGLRDAVADRWHWSRDMPGLTRRVPELRDAAFYRRLFFHHRTASFDLAVAALATAALGRRPWPLVATAPYARWVLREAGAFPAGRRVRAAVAAVAGDATVAAGLAVGSLAWRSPLL
jgi:glycosyltransferase involved in cell wall biosynthesis